MANLTCVVGRCTQSQSHVKRCFWNGGEDHAYLDLCYFHQTYFQTRHVTHVIEGWDPKKEEEEVDGG